MYLNGYVLSTLNDDLYLNRYLYYTNLAQN